MISLKCVYVRGLDQQGPVQPVRNAKQGSARLDPETEKKDDFRGERLSSKARAFGFDCTTLSAGKDKDIQAWKRGRSGARRIRSFCARVHQHRASPAEPLRLHCAPLEAYEAELTAARSSQLVHWAEFATDTGIGMNRKALAPLTLPFIP